MPKDPNAKFRQAISIGKLYTDDKINQLTQEINKRFGDIKIPEIPEPVTVDVQEIAKQVSSIIAPPKNLKRKKKNKAPMITPEEVMALIHGSLEEIKKEYVSTGDTIVIQEAPQTVVEKLREVIRVEEKEAKIDYDKIYKELDKRMIEWRQTIPNYGGGSYNALSMLQDVKLEGIPQDEYGNYLLNSIAGGNSANSFETVSKNLESYPFTVNYDLQERVDNVVYTTDGGSITKSITYNASSQVITVTLSGDLPAGLTHSIKNISYTPDGKVSTVSYS